MARQGAAGRSSRPRGCCRRHRKPGRQAGRDGRSWCQGWKGWGCPLGAAGTGFASPWLAQGGGPISGLDGLAVCWWATLVVGPLGTDSLEAPMGLGLDWPDLGSARGPNCQRLMSSLLTRQLLTRQLLTRQLLTRQLLISQSIIRQLLGSQPLSSPQPRVSSGTIRPAGCRNRKGRGARSLPAGHWGRGPSGAGC